MTEEEEFPIDEQALLARLTEQTPEFWNSMTEEERAFELSMRVNAQRIYLRNQKYPPPRQPWHNNKATGLDENYKPFPVDD
ncbi:hypothetical protein [Kibdelosporangium phytohabitans]|uniref:Uncharacterized protein n=1 Tax=Kibdelosporangium phytohabitans TaxID=860235 RepID=A0A0N9I5B5_9PSEU|nr:hypothetical protein [Kibdelosporangium phytohabitans]ALG13256.1 hypothetical protein AOZ06_46070 [Kibdelosporangium phytohabitans]MBE1465027.1 hypothetical protein [Kibdelosporangium phytohabitans]